MLNKDTYQGFNESDFICDPYFQEWVINSNVEHELFWKGFFEEYPDKKPTCESARNFLLNLRFKESFPDEDVIENSFTKHLSEIGKFKGSKVIDIRKKFPLKRLLSVAAVFGGVLLILSALLIYNNNKDKPVLVKTEYGNIKSIILPDSSSVILNGNSAIRFAGNWRKAKSREVWLQGEAFFDVRHLNRNINDVKKPELFIVHTDDLIIEVLGTSFDIRQRRGRTEVVLQTGRIKVSFEDQKRKEIIMKPGERLAYDAHEDQLSTGTTDPRDFSAWKEKKLLLDDPTAADVIEYLEDVFGKDLVLENPELAKRKIEGPILLTNLDDALLVLSTVLDAEIIRKDSTIILRPR